MATLGEFVTASSRAELERIARHVAKRRRDMESKRKVRETWRSSGDTRALEYVRALYK